MKRIILIFFAIAITFPVFAGEIKYLKTSNKFPIFNKKTNKIINYYILKKDEEIKFSTVNIDTIIILSRVVMEESSSFSYDYELQINDEIHQINKIIKPSKVSLSVNGKRVSAYNKVRKEIIETSSKIGIKNISEFELLIKISADNITKSNREIEYIYFSPASYDKEKVMEIDEKSYTYYSADSQNIKLTLEGPIYLKIISRLIFENGLTKSYNYRFDVFDNEKLVSTFEEVAHKSLKAILPEELKKTPSTGDVNILKLPEGIHHLEIKDIDLNRELIFRFYISKSSVRISE